MLSLPFPPASIALSLSLSFFLWNLRLVPSDRILSLYRLCSFSLLPLLISSVALSLWYALRFAARGDAPLPAEGSPPRRQLAGLEIPTTRPEQLIREGGQPPLTPSRFGRISLSATRR